MGETIGSLEIRHLENAMPGRLLGDQAPDESEGPEIWPLEIAEDQVIHLTADDYGTENLPRYRTTKLRAAPVAAPFERPDHEFETD